MNEKICGTYWLVAMPDGSKFITQGKDKPKRCVDSWIKAPSDIGWLFIGGDNSKWQALRASRTKAGDIVRTADYKDINFPDITWEDGPMEIEIGKSGRVYTYEP